MDLEGSSSNGVALRSKMCSAYWFLKEAWMLYDPLLRLDGILMTTHIDIIHALLGVHKDGAAHVCI